MSAVRLHRRHAETGQALARAVGYEFTFDPEGSAR